MRIIREITRAGVVVERKVVKATRSGEVYQVNTAAATTVRNETPTGAMNGANATFTSAYEFVPESVFVTLNGLNLQPVVEFHTTGQQTVVLHTSPTNEDVLLISYERA